MKVPRFPTFLGEAIDKTEAKDAEIPRRRRLGESTSNAQHGDGEQ